MSNAFRIEVKGIKTLQKKLDTAAKIAPIKLDKLLAEAAFMVDAEAKRSIQNPPKSGNIYKRRGISHQASAPGQAPATDTGLLVSNISAVRERFLEYSSGSREKLNPHGFWLEFGTSKMVRRPWLTPATMKANRWLRAALKGLAIHGR